MNKGKSDPIRFLCAACVCLLILTSCGGTHGRIGLVWIDLPQDSVVTLLVLDSILVVQPSFTKVSGHESVYLEVPVTSVSSDIDTMLIQITVDAVETGQLGCRVCLVGYKPHGIYRYCMNGECPADQNEVALRLFEAVVLEPLRMRANVGEIES